MHYKILSESNKTHQDKLQSPFMLSALPTTWSSIYFSLYNEKKCQSFFLFLQKTLIKILKNQLYLRKCSPVTYRFHSDDLWSIIIAIRKVLSSLQYLTGPTHASTLRGKWNNIGVRLANKFFAFLTALGYWLLHSC